MNESLPTGETEDKNKSTGSGAGLAFMAAMLALAALAGSGWLWWQSYGEGDQAAEKLTQQAASQRQAMAEMGSRLNQLESRIAALPASDPAGKLADLEQALNSLQTKAADSTAFQQETAAWTRSMQASIEGDQARLAGVEARLAALSHRSMDASSELDLAEIGYVLRLAQERLQLFGDTRTATQALRIAEQQIAAFDNPLYLGIQREIGLAMQSLAQVQGPDDSAVFRNLDSLQAVLPKLPFRKSVTGTAEEAPAGEEGGWWERLKKSLSGLVTVRRSTDPDAVPPVLADQALVLQQAWIELELARLSLMRRDQASWTLALVRVTAALDKWFDPGSPGMAQARTLLADLKAVNVDPELPDISAPWVALQAIRASGVAAPAAAGSGEAGPGREAQPANTAGAEEPAMDDDAPRPETEESATAGDSGQ